MGNGMSSSPTSKTSWVVQPHRPDLRGVDVKTLIDPTGYEYGRDFTNAAAAGQWTSYVFLHPETGVETPNHSWLVREEGMIFAAAWWQ